MRTPRTSRAATLLAALVISGCGSQDFFAALPTEPRETTLFDLFGPIIERPAAFDLATGPGASRTDLTSQWDFVFAITPPGAAGCFSGFAAGDPVFLPRGCFEGLEASSGLMQSTRTFEEVVTASGIADDYVSETALPADSGAVYVLRSRPDPGLSSTCRRYLKLEVLSVNAVTGALTFRFLWNPNCNLRNLPTGSTES